jgi:nicotinate-nucleotide adenylyltransferase
MRWLGLGRDNECRPSRTFAGLPPHGARQRIGIYGGSFNPPHAGHRRVSLMALARLGLDRLWWMVTPGNPLKDPAGLPPIEERMQDAAEVAAHPRIDVSGAEAAFGTRYTADLIDLLKERAPAVRFVWVMGSDNLAQFHRWERWRDIAAAVPIAVINRPGFLAAPLSAPAAQALRPHRIAGEDAAILADCEPPAWIFLVGPRTAASSTALRATNGGRHGDFHNRPAEPSPA